MPMKRIVCSGLETSVAGLRHSKRPNFVIGVVWAAADIVQFEVGEEWNHDYTTPWMEPRLR